MEVILTDKTFLPKRRKEFGGLYLLNFNYSTFPKVTVSSLKILLYIRQEKNIFLELLCLGFMLA